jgi:PAT family beta-lactamase induction signal transducer AmpG
LRCGGRPVCYGRRAGFDIATGESRRSFVARRLPVWLLGLANLPLGITGAVALLITPEVLAARHVPETTIANITTFGLASTIFFFLVAPILDVRFTRRTYAIAMSIAASVLTVVAVLNFSSVGLLGLWLFLCMLAANLNSAAIGGWFGSILPHEDDAPLGAWMTLANVVGFGVTAILGIMLVHQTALWISALVLGSLNLLPLLIIFWVQPPTDERRRASETFGRFGNELMQLARRRDVRRLLLLLALPCASFALTNTLGGLGGDYHASEKLIALIGGIGVTLAGVLGSLSVPVLSRRFPLIGVYLGIGIVGGLSTLLLLVLPRTAAIFTLAFVLQNIWQSAGLSTGNALALSSIGKNNPLASTQFAVLTAAMSAPITYMQLVDGHAYGAHGLTGLYLTDGGLDLIACAAMTMLFLYWSRQVRRGGTDSLAAALGEQ